MKSCGRCPARLAAQGARVLTMANTAGSHHMSGAKIAMPQMEGARPMETPAGPRSTPGARMAAMRGGPS